MTIPAATSETLSGVTHLPTTQKGRTVGINPSMRRASPTKNTAIGKNGLTSE